MSSVKDRIEGGAGVSGGSMYSGCWVLGLFVPETPFPTVFFKLSRTIRNLSRTGDAGAEAKVGPPFVMVVSLNYPESQVETKSNELLSVGFLLLMAISVHSTPRANNKKTIGVCLYHTYSHFVRSVGLSQPAIGKGGGSRLDGRFEKRN